MARPWGRAIPRGARTPQATGTGISLELDEPRAAAPNAANPLSFARAALGHVALERRFARDVRVRGERFGDLLVVLRVVRRERFRIDARLVGLRAYGEGDSRLFRGSG